MEYESVIGLETHCQLKTKSKMFCGCANEFGAAPNTNVCPICLGMPGVLPVPNELALQLTVLTGYLLNCEIPKFAKFDRKNYFYPDVCKDYQITQFDFPSTTTGYVDFESGSKIDGEGVINISQIPFDPLAFEDIFILNTNMTPLVPYDLNSGLISGLINMPSSAFRFSIKGNYTNSKILIEYRQIGPEYVTLGNPFLRNNTRQFTISDRASFLKNKLFINFGFKHLDNKILRTTVNLSLIHI